LGSRILESEPLAPGVVVRGPQHPGISAPGVPPLKDPPPAPGSPGAGGFVSLPYLPLSGLPIPSQHRRAIPDISRRSLVMLPLEAQYEEGRVLFYHDKRLQYHAKPERPDPVYAKKLQEVLG